MHKYVTQVHAVQPSITDRSGFIVQQRGKGGGSGDGGMESGGGWGDREISSAEFALVSISIILHMVL